MKTYQQFIEEVAANAMGAGGFNVGQAAETGSPYLAGFDMPFGTMKKRKQQRESFAGCPVFTVSNDDYAKCMHGRMRYERWNKKLNMEEIDNQEIRTYAHRNPGKPIIVKDDRYGTMSYFVPPKQEVSESVELDEFTVPGYDQDKTLKANMPKWRKDADKRTREQSKKVKVRKTRPLTNPMKPTDESVKIEEGGKDVVKIGEPITIGLDFKNTIGDKKNKKSRDSYLDRELAKILGTKKPKSGPKSKYPAGDHPGLDPDLELESVELQDSTKESLARFMGEKVVTGEDGVKRLKGAFKSEPPFHGMSQKAWDAAKARREGKAKGKPKQQNNSVEYDGDGIQDVEDTPNMNLILERMLRTKKKLEESKEAEYYLDEAAFLAAIPALLGSLGSAAAGAGSAIVGAAGTAAGAAGSALASGGAMAGRAALGAGRMAASAGKAGLASKPVVAARGGLAKQAAKIPGTTGRALRTPMKKIPGKIAARLPGKAAVKSGAGNVVTQGAMMAPVMMMGGGKAPKPNTTVQTSAQPTQQAPTPATGANSASNARARARQQLRQSFNPRETHDGQQLDEFLGGMMKMLSRRKAVPKAPAPKVAPKAPLPQGTVSMLPAKPGGTPLVTNNPSLINAPGHKTTYFNTPKSAAGAVKTPTGPNLGKFGPTPTNAPSARKFVQAQKQGRIDLDKMKTTNAPYATGSAAHTQAKTAIQPKLAKLKTQLQQRRSQGVTTGRSELRLAPSSGAKISTAPKVEVPLTLKQKIKQGVKKAFAPGTKDTPSGIGRRAAGQLGTAATTAYMFNKMAGKPEPPDKTIHSTAPLAASFERIPSEGEQRLNEMKTDRLQRYAKDASAELGGVFQTHLDAKGGLKRRNRRKGVNKAIDRLATRKTRMYQGGERGSEIK